MSKVKFPDVKVQLSGQDGNAFMIIGRVMKEMHRKGVDKTEIDEYQKMAMSGDYSNVLAVTMDWVTVS